MIPDIALMIVVYGAARLIVATLDPYRRNPAGGTMAQVATAVTWMVAAAAIAGLALLGVLVMSSSASLSGIGSN